MKRRVIKWNFLYTLGTRFNLWSHFPSSKNAVPSATLQGNDVWEKTAPILLSWGLWIADTERSSSIPVTLHEFNGLGKFQCLILHIWCRESAKAETLRNEVTRLPGVKANSQHRELMTNRICGSVSTTLCFATVGVSGTPSFSCHWFKSELLPVKLKW